MKYVIKNNKDHEEFSEEKLNSSIFLACLSVQESTSIAKDLANEVTSNVIDWMESKNEVSTKEIRKKAGNCLYKLNPHAGYVYLHHRIMW